MAIERECAAAILAPLPAGTPAARESYGQGFRETFRPLLNELREHQQSGLHRNSLERLVGIGDALVLALPWRSFEEFDAFMLNDELELVL